MAHTLYPADSLSGGLSRGGILEYLLEIPTNSGWGIAQARDIERGREKRIGKREGERVRERGGEMEGV